MKTFILTLATLLCVINSQLSAQKIQYLNSSIQITNDAGFSTTGNVIRYQITSNITDDDQLQSLFPDKTFSVINGLVTFSGEIQVDNMWQLIDMLEIEQVDVGKKLKKAIIVWSTNIIYSQNLLGLDLTKWSINPQ